MIYKLLNTSIGIQYVAKIDGDVMTTFGPDLANADYQQYLAWLAEGNEPEPAEE
jgi:hypothetical protein